MHVTGSMGACGKGAECGTESGFCHIGLGKSVVCCCGDIISGKMLQKVHVFLTKIRFFEEKVTKW